jgi:hypothetical protein
MKTQRSNQGCDANGGSSKCLHGQVSRWRQDRVLAYLILNQNVASEAVTMTA